MAVEQVTISCASPPKAALSNGKQSGLPAATLPHPLAQLDARELTSTAAAIKQLYPGQLIRFKFISINEPPKALLQPYLAAQRAGAPLPYVPRIANLLYAVGKGRESRFVEGKFDVGRGKLVSETPVSPDDKPSTDIDELEELEEALMKHPVFLESLKRFKLPANAVVTADPWIYGSDTYDPIDRLFTFMVYMRNPANNDPDSNHYAFPLPICPVMRASDKELIDIIDTATGDESDGHATCIFDKEDPMGHLTGSEYLQELRGVAPRTDVKPYLVSQPEGVSFRLEGNKLFWQKWEFILSFNPREGLVIHDVHYDGRSVFYRLSMAEMTVPYGDPRAPAHRKQAFDVGDVGLGICANTLDLGCDCLGVIKYLSTLFCTPDGSAREAKNIVCIHEVDDGLQSKHTNYRTNRATVIRSRHLVLQTIATVSNYEYIWIWKFDQAGALHFECRATGILSTSYIDKGKVSPYGNVVAPGVMAPNHQHLFCLRIDPAIEGSKNTVVYEDSVPMPISELNPYGVAWTVEKTAVKEAGWVDAAPFSNRVFKIVNKSVTNPVSQRPVGYKLVPHPSQLMLADPASVAFARAQFGDHHVWVTKYQDDELFPAGNYTNQSCGKAGGIKTMIARKDNVEDEDLVIWNTFSLTHNPRVEDFPVMPYESLQVSLKPADFFTCNPALDVPESRQAFNKSVLADEVKQGCCA